MAIFLTGESRIMIQGITGSEGAKHGRRMLAAGTTVVGGTNPRKAGQTVDLGSSASAGVRHGGRDHGGDRCGHLGGLRPSGRCQEAR